MDLQESEICSVTMEERSVCEAVYISFCYFQALFLHTIICFSIGTPKNNKFSICSKWKINDFCVSQNLGTFQPNYIVLKYWYT